jgi:hypothetical protein
VLKTDLTQLTDLMIRGREAYVARMLIGLPISLLRLRHLEIGGLTPISMNLMVTLLTSSSPSLIRLTLPPIATSDTVRTPTHYNTDTISNFITSSTSSTNESLTAPILMPNLTSLTTSSVSIVSSSWYFPLMIGPALEQLDTWLPWPRLTHLLASNQSRLKYLDWIASPTIRTYDIYELSSSFTTVPIVTMRDVPLISFGGLESLTIQRSLHDFMAIIDRCCSSLLLTKISWFYHEHFEPTTAKSNNNCDELVASLSHIRNLITLKLTGSNDIEWSSYPLFDYKSSSSTSLSSASSSSNDEEKNTRKREYCLERLESLTLEGNWLLSSFLSIIHFSSVKSISIFDSSLKKQKKHTSSTSTASIHLDHQRIVISAPQLMELTLNSAYDNNVALPNNSSHYYVTININLCDSIASNYL